MTRLGYCAFGVGMTRLPKIKQARFKDGPAAFDAAFVQNLGSSSSIFRDDQRHIYQVLVQEPLL